MVSSGKYRRCSAVRQRSRMIERWARGFAVLFGNWGSEICAPAREVRQAILPRTYCVPSSRWAVRMSHGTRAAVARRAVQSWRIGPLVALPSRIHEPRAATSLRLRA